MDKNALKSGTGTVTQRLKGSSMPIYEFKCPQCHISVEQSFSVYMDPVIRCQDCGVNMDKQFSSPGVIFKGDGWAGKTN